MNACIPEEEEDPEDKDSSSRLKSNEDERMIKDVRFVRSSPERMMTPAMMMSQEMRRVRACSVESNDSSCSEFDMEGVMPLTLDDICFQSNYFQDSRRGSSGSIKTHSEDESYDPTEGGRFFSVAMALKRKARGPSKPQTRGKTNWNRALKLIKDRGDPWEKFHFEEMKEEKGIRKRYNPISREWVEDECVVKIDSHPFANGAMRECYRMKKLSNFSLKQDWACDSNNYVAKRYMDPNTESNTYFDDVKLQMDAKLWGEEFNRHNPPKKVDIFMMCVIELPNRPGAPLFHVEHYIDGDYIKYNSNSGFVAEGQCRQTPQSFSHFSFERSGHEVIVVDIQGVGDLYTDPQIHTANGTEYGDGNLGTKGMALFFNSHLCNSICHSLGLTQFDLAKSEAELLKNSSRQNSISSHTKVRLDEVVLCESPSTVERADFRRIFRERSGSTGGYFSYESGQSHENPSPPRQISESSEHGVQFCIEAMDEDDDEGMAPQRGDTASSKDSRSSLDSGVFFLGPRRRRQKGITECMDDPQDQLAVRMARVSRPSCVFREVERRKLTNACPCDDIIQVDNCECEEDSVLGQIHLDLAKYHECCRFDMDHMDLAAAIFHLRSAADCGNIQALVAISQMLTGLRNDVLPSLSLVDIEGVVEGNVTDIGLDYTVTAANQGDVSSMRYLAEAYDTGLNLGSDRTQSHLEALHWYEKAVDKEADQSYLLQARMAQILLMPNSGQMDANRAGELYNEAAEAAMEDMKGKLATKYYALAEEAWSLVEDPEEQE